MKKTPTSGLRRVAALGLGLAMIGGLSLVAAAPASAAPETHTATGTVTGMTETGHAPLTGAEFAIEDGASAVTDSDGVFSLSVEDGHYEFTISADGYLPYSSGLDVEGSNVDFGEFNLVQDLPEEPARFSINGVITAKDANPAFAPTATLYPSDGTSPWYTPVDADGKFSFENLLPAADLTVVIAAEGYATQNKTVSITDADVNLSVELLTPVPAGTVTLSGDHVAGGTLTATPAGWPAGTTFSYQWGAVAPGQQNSGDIHDFDAAQLPVTAELAGKLIWVQAIGHLDGFADGYSTGNTSSTPQLPIAAAPVADSADLAAFLEAAGSAPLTQTAAGLPAGDLNPTQSYSANVPFAGSDSFVDAYLYSSPISVGSFPVVNGVAQVTLSADVLGQLAAGSHTLVVVGQFSGTVSSVTISVAAVLAETGANPAPLGATAALLALLGVAALVAVRRRRAHV
ncbi:hypothetical protein GCM10022381_19250 [Leifsonia kafniensis]|uniref:Gram-positive cocci surface proteins LPxTG domain-containing protein n=1 Tax=Leifsonia kafniensis TaxID=475957 RepID=A0ABP7KGK1_9MICO